jgi:hypothetical protein
VKFLFLRPEGWLPDDVTDGADDSVSLSSSDSGVLLLVNNYEILFIIYYVPLSMSTEASESPESVRLECAPDSPLVKLAMPSACERMTYRVSKVYA